MKHGKILVADGDVAAVEEIRAQLTRLSFEMLWAPNGHEVVKSFIHHVPDAVILRDTLPDFDGWETARLIRAISATPIIFISDLTDRLSRKRALLLGDDIMTPPYQWERLPARLAALLKRSANYVPSLPDLYDDGYLVVDISGRLVARDGKPVDLSNTEFKLLSCFVRHPNRTLTYLAILQSVWGHGYLKAKSDVSQYVRYLRQKIELDPERPDYFHSVRGIGYLFMPRL
jgi:DNA-binding response OmpR family regulator